MDFFVCLFFVFYVRRQQIPTQCLEVGGAQWQLVGLAFMIFVIWRMNSWSNNINTRLFMAAHLVRAQSTSKDIRIHSFHSHRHTHTHTHTHNPDMHTHTHTHTHIHTHYKYMVMDWYNNKCSRNCGCYLYEQPTLEQCWQYFHHCQRKKD